MMNPEILERLVIDRALGELPPDAATLLDAYLEGNAEMADTAREIEATMQLAKQALKETRPVKLPIMQPVPKLVVLPGGRESWQQPVYRAYGMAACFAGGLMIGWLTLRSPNPVPPVKVESVMVASHGTAGEEGFWSLRRLRQTTTRTPLESGPELVWKSPVKVPEIKTSL
jgi:anti-sigma factor RsiW